MKKTMIKKTTMRKRISKYMGIVILSIILISCGYAYYKMLNRQYDYNGEIVRSRNELHFQGLKDQLVTAVDQYIQTIGPGSCVNALVLVDMCDKYNLDLKFVLSQGHIESHFGTKGIAAKTNSVFNVMSFDGLSAKDILSSGKGYSHPDHSIEPYMKLLTTKYLVDKTEMDLFVEFVNMHGERYASNKNYETQMLGIYEKIDSIVPITPIIKEYNKYKILTK